MIDTHVTIPGKSNVFCNYIQWIYKFFFVLGEDVPEPVQDESDSDKESECDISELIFVPGDPSALQPMYEALKECQV